jgi:hypothetical protein
MPVIELEYQLLRKYYSKYFKAKEFYYAYPSTDDSNINKILSPNTLGMNILLGNSSSLTNNHLDILESIKNYLDDVSEVIMPLNYGRTDYAQILINKVKNNNKIRPLIHFLEKEKYDELMRSCSFLILGVMRQQAVGNIVLAVKNGMKIFLYEDSLMYKYMKQCGYIVYSIESINRESFSVPLNDFEKKHNLVLLLKEAKRRNNIYEQFISDAQLASER